MQKKKIRNNYSGSILAIAAEPADVFYCFKQKTRGKTYLAFCNTTTSKIVLDNNLMNTLRIRSFTVTHFKDAQKHVRE